jgi:hypothetical protein
VYLLFQVSQKGKRNIRRRLPEALLSHILALTPKMRVGMRDDQLFFRVTFQFENIRANKAVVRKVRPRDQVSIDQIFASCTAEP